MTGSVSAFQSANVAAAGSNGLDATTYLRFDIVDISLLAVDGTQRTYTRREHTETFITQARCQREHTGL
jgi:hypothetical protein